MPVVPVVVHVGETAVRSTRRVVAVEVVVVHASAVEEVIRGPRRRVRVPVVAVRVVEGRS